MMKSPLYIIVFLILLPAVFVTSCEKDVMLNLPAEEGNYLVVDANIGNVEGRQMVILSWSGSYYEEERSNPVSDAIISVSDGEAEYFFTERSSGKGEYYNTEIWENMDIGNYYLTIDTGSKIYTAQSEFREVPGLDSLTYRLNFISGLGLVDEPFYDIHVHFRNLPETGNFYLINLYINDRIKTHTPVQKTVVSDANLDAYVSLYTTTIRESDLSQGDTLTAEIRSISKRHFDFYSNFLFQTELSGNPYAGAPPANIPTNLSEGARGFFQVSSVKTSSRIFTPKNK